MSNNSGLSVLGVIAGVAVGAGVGILFAPDKGDKTRKRIKDGYKDLEKDMKAKLANAKVDLEDTYEELLSNMSYKTEDVISFLETKLADLKQQNAKLHK